MDKEYLTIKEIWDFINKIMPGAISQKDGNYSLQALECLFFVTENQGKRLNSESIAKPRHKEWCDNREELKKNRVAVKEKCKNCKECRLSQCCMKPGKEPPESFRAQLTFVVATAVWLSAVTKKIISEFLHEKEFHNSSRKIQELDEDNEEFSTKAAEIIVELVAWKESDKNTKSLQKIKSDFQQQKGQLLLLRNKFNELGYTDQWWQEIAEILVSVPSKYDEDDLDIREEKVWDAAEENNCKNERRLLEKFLAEGRARCRRYISGQRCRIKNLRMKYMKSPPKSEAWKDEIIKIYEEITHLSEEYQIEYSTFLEYSEFLYSQKKYDEGIEVAKRLNQLYELRTETPDADKAKLYVQLGELYCENQDFDKSLRFCKYAQKILEKDPYRYVMERVRAYNTMSDNYWRMNHSNKAKKYAKEALELIKRHNMSSDRLTDDESLSIARTYRRLAVLSKREWNLDAAEDYYHEGLAIEEELYNNNPGNDKFAQALAATCSNLGIVYRNMKKYEKGEKIYQKSFNIREKKYRKSNDLTFKWSFAVTAGNYAYLLACTHRQSDAETKMEEIALPVKRMLAEQYPDKIKYQRSYAFSLKDYGFILSCADSDDDGKWEKADKYFLESMDIAEQCLKKEPQGHESYEDLIATINFEYGCLLKKMGRESEAITRFRNALNIYQSLNGDGQYFVHDIGMAALELAELLSKSEDTWAEAKTAYEQALTFGEKIPETSQKYYREEYVRTLNGYIDVLQRQECPEDQPKIESLKEKLEKNNTNGSVEDA